jgi:mannose-6-phosphate isomerase-like protein (cupin superfamily)
MPRCQFLSQAIRCAYPSRGGERIQYAANVSGIRRSDDRHAASVFIVQEGTATFTAGDETVEVKDGQVVVVPAGVAHKFVNSGEDRLRQVDIHASERFVTEWLEN